MEILQKADRHYDNVALNQHAQYIVLLRDVAELRRLSDIKASVERIDIDNTGLENKLDHGTRYYQLGAQ